MQPVVPLRILVVDDDPIALEVARERLIRLGFDVTTRSESLGTTGWILQNRPDCVLLDVMMPALSGSELANVLRRRSVDTCIILHSSKPQSELDTLVRETGASGAISKASDERRFAETILLLTRRLARGAEA
jgi:DNA-binding response OmpR family regulator